MHVQGVIVYLVLSIIGINAMDSIENSGEYVNRSLVEASVCRRVDCILHAITARSRKRADYSKQIEALDKLVAMFDEDTFKKDQICAQDFEVMDEHIVGIEKAVFKMRGQKFTQEDRIPQQTKETKIRSPKHRHTNKFQDLTTKINTIKTVLIKNNETMVVKDDINNHVLPITLEQPEFENISHEPDNKANVTEPFSKIALLGRGFGFTGILAVVAYYLYIQLKKNNVALNTEVREKKPEIDCHSNTKQKEDELLNVQKCKA